MAESQGDSISEIDLVERVFLRIASADSDEQFQSCLARFLNAILLKLTSTDDAVRKKVMELLSHINMRLRNRPKVLLPVDSILTQYMSSEMALIVHNFALIYLKMGFERLHQSDKVLFFPKLISCVNDKPPSHQDVIFHLIIDVLEDAISLEYPNRYGEELKSLSKTACKVNWMSYIRGFLALPYTQQEGKPDLSPPPCMSINLHSRIKKDANLAPDNIEKGKLGILKLLSCDVFSIGDVLPLLVMSSSDPRHRVGDKAEHAIKKISNSDDWNQKEVIENLFLLYQGTTVARGSKNQAQNKEDCITPASARQKMKIFPYLLKSRTAGDYSAMACIQVIYDGLFGNGTNSKLQHYAVEFTHHVCEVASDRNIKMGALLYFQALTKVAFDPKQDQKLVNLSFTGLGKLARREPSMFRKDVSILQKLFQKLEEDNVDLRLAVLQSISMIAPAYKNVSQADANLLEILILSNAEKDATQIRLGSLQLAHAVFPSTHVLSRFVCLLLSNDPRDDVREEALKGLHLKITTDSSNEDEVVSYPEFFSMVTFVHSKLIAKSQSNAEKHGIHTSVLMNVILYLRKCLYFAAGVTKEMENADTFLPTLCKYLKTEKNMKEHNNCYLEYLDILHLGIPSSSGSGLLAQSLECLVEFSAVLHSHFQHHTIFSSQIAKANLKSSNETVRFYSAKLLSFICMHLNQDESLSLLNNVMVNVQSNVPEVKHGSILAVASCLASLLRSNTYGDAYTLKLSKIVSTFFKQLHDMINIENTKLCHFICIAVGLIGQQIALPISNGEKDVVSNDDAFTKLILVQKFIHLFTKTKDKKNQEAAATALGLLCVGDPNFPHKDLIISALLESSKERQTELNFTVGESLSCVVVGRMSIKGRDKWSVSDATFDNDDSCDDSCLEEVITKIEKDYAGNSAPFVRQASAIWLLCLTKFITNRGLIVEKLPRIQMMFVALLADADAIAQEVASRGLGLVYDLVDDSVKSELVSVLVGRLMSGKRPKQTVENNTTVFQNGSLGNTPDGSSLSTYKEICSLATSLNRPDLVYKFMNLANHHAMWNSKKGAAFGFLGIASRAKEQLQPFLPQMIPQLFRYQFDPNPDVQQAMKNIWSAIAPSGKRTFDAYTDIILKDLLANLVNPAWRVRESSCFALNDLIKSCDIGNIVGCLGDIWAVLFKVLDDIKESVRKAAAVAAKTMSRITCRVCNVDQVPSMCEKALMSTLPVLLDNGITSRVADVRAISLDTMVKLTKSAGKLLRPHIAKLIVPLLESLSGLEPQELNMLSLHLNNSKDKQEQLDLIRISASKSSPMMEAINFCVRQIDDEIMPQVIPRLIELLRHSIGVGTKSGCCSVVNSLVLQSRDSITPYAGKILSALLAGLTDQSTVVRKTYSDSIGQLAVFSKESSIEKLLIKLRSWYLEKTDETRLRESCCWTIKALAKHGDVAKTHASAIIPLVFVAMHEENEPEESNLKATWDDIWNSIAPGLQTGIKLYLSEIMMIINDTMQNASWRLRRQGARAMATVANSLGSLISGDKLVTIVTMLLGSLRGSHWEGKEQLLNSLSLVLVKCKSTVTELKPSETSTEPTLFQQCVAELFKGCNKSKDVYKRTAVKAFSDVVEAFQIDRYSDVWKLVSHEFAKCADKGKDDSSRDDDDLPSDDLIVACYGAVGSCWPTQISTQRDHCEATTTLLLSHLSKNTWRTRMTIFKSLEKFNSRFQFGNNEASPSPSFTSSYAAMATEAITQCLDTAPQAILQLQCIKCAVVLATSLKEHGLSLSKLTDVTQLKDVIKRKCINNSPEVTRTSDQLLEILKLNS